MANFLPGIKSRTVATARLRIHCRESGSPDGVPVVLLHGNVSAGAFWEDLMVALPPGYRVLAPDLRGYGDTEALPVDATRGVRDWSDDLHALAGALGLGASGRPFHVVGWSMGAGVAMQYAIDHAADLLTVTLESPVSPYGFGGCKGADGAPCCADFAGSGGGTANPDFVQRLAAGDRGAESPNSPRNVMNSFYFKPPFRAAPEREEAYVSAMLSTRIGDDFYPGDLTPSANWPGVGPGGRGINNTMSPRWFNLAAFADIRPQPSVLCIRGADDLIVSDSSFFCFGFLGAQGWVPGWPGADVYPPQPMVSQGRSVLERYAAQGGAYREVVLPGAGHSPHIEAQAAVVDLLLGAWG